MQKNNALKKQQRNIFKVLYTASSVLLLAVSFGTTSSCTTNKPEEIRVISNREDMSSLSYKELESVITDSGKVKYRLYAPNVEQYEFKEEPYTDFKNGFKLKVYESDGSIDAKINCRNAYYYKQKQLWELNDNVVAQNQKGEILNTEQLFWDMREHTMYSDKFVKITTDTEIITGTGFQADENMRDWEINNISGILEVKE